MAEPQPHRIDIAEPLVEVFSWFKGLVPTSLKPGRPHFNFITVHYCYLISLTILGSIIIYPIKTFSYTDALFFSAGSSTQSGLNTVDFNLLALYQQVVLMLIGCVANPVFINTVVVFIRLYWFEKRFQGIVKEAQRTRRTRTMSRTKSMMMGEKNEDAVENGFGKGVNGREIKVLHDTTQPNGMNHKAVDSDDHSDLISPKTKLPALDTNGLHGGPKDLEDPQSADRFLGRNPLPRRDIVFADENNALAKKIASKDQSSPEEDRLPDQRDPEHHIAFLEKQRKLDQTTLRIPGPRDFDRGDVPREVSSDEEDGDLERIQTLDHAALSNGSTAPRRESDDTLEDRANANPGKRGIAFDVPEKPQKKKSAKAGEDEGPPSPRFNPLRPFSNFNGPRRRISSTTLFSTLHKIKDAPRTFSRTKSQASEDFPGIMPYLSWQPTIGRNSQFMDLTEEQREELGGIEYRSLKTLAIILVFYFVGFHLLGMLVLLPWIVTSKTYGPVVDNVSQNRAWWGIFTPASMFNDLGFTLTPDSMNSFNTAVLPLLFGSFLIIIGNTGFPCMLRFVIWVGFKMTRNGSAIWEELRFLLDHPRRCFTLLFPSRATWWLFWLLVLLNVIDLVFFIILDLNDETVTALAPGIRVLDGWFQAVSTRTAGFSCVNLANLHPAIQVSYLVMMYISVFPIAISVRRTNVYEEKSLGLWGGEDEEGEETNKSFVGMHLRRQLSFDLWYIFLGLFVIAIVEGPSLQNTNAYAFTLFSCLFEIVSAYGTVGLSLGYPNTNASFSAQFGTISKLVIVAMMIRGRHRGLPYALDRAILLPSESLHKKEAEDAALRSQRRNSMSISKIPTDEHPGLTHAQTMNTTATAVSGVSMPSQIPGLTQSNTSPTAFRRMHTRRESELSEKSRAQSTRSRGRTLTSLISAGLSAGPSSPVSLKR